MTTIFYAWQSDRDEKSCRYLIRDAAKLAVKKLASDAAVKSAPAIDEATKGVSGHPHIAATIRKKIRACGCFICDLTHVAKYTTSDGRKKKSQNGNVLIELGIAINRRRGFEKLIMVMNDHYGKPEDLPFDLKSHSFPITYTLAPNSDPAVVTQARHELAKKIAEKLKPILVLISSEEKAASQTVNSSEPSDEFLTRVEQERQSFESLMKQKLYYRWDDVNRCVATVLIIPAKQKFPRLTLKEPFLQTNEGYFQPFGREFGLQRSDTHSLYRLELFQDDRVSATAEITNIGTIRGVERWGEDFGVKVANDDIVDIEINRHEPQASISILNYLKTLRTLKVEGPYAVCFSLFNANNSMLLPSPSIIRRTSPIAKFYVECDPVFIPQDFPEDRPSFMKLLRNMWDQLWRGYGWVDGSRFYDDHTGEYTRLPERG